VPTRATLWDEKLRGGPAESVSLPVQAAARATDMVRCFTHFRASLPREDAKILGLLRDLCPRVVREGQSPAVLDLMRELVGIAPSSAFVQGTLGLNLMRRILVARPQDWPALSREAEIATRAALRADPSNEEARQANSYLLVAQGSLKDAFAKSSVGSDIDRLDLLQQMSVGRYKVANPAGRVAI